MKHCLLITGFLLCFVTPFAAQKPIDDYASQLAKATPPALPQSPTVKREGNDTRDDQLKGRVNSVITEKEYLDGTEYPPGRHIDGQREFAVDGNLVRQVFTDYRGNISFVVVYGYIDGKRVSKAGPFIRHSYDPPPIAALPLGAAKSSPPKGDERYTGSWEHKYDKEGRLIEEVSLNNSGKAINKTTYEYGNLTQKESFCSLPCEETFTTVSDLDSTGNIVKSEYDNAQTVMPVDSIVTHKYLSFDANGNWTKREITGLRATSLSAVKPIHFIEYRTITYYP